MDKLVKKEVLTVYISQFAILIVALCCFWLPLFYDSPIMTRWKAISGFFILAGIFLANIFYITTLFSKQHRILPAKLALEAFSEMLYKMDDNCNKGLFSKEETDKCKQRYNTTLEWLERYRALGLPLLIFDCITIGLSIAGIIIIQIVKHQFVFCSFFGVAGFFLVMQTTYLFISYRFLWKSVLAWIEKLRNIK